MIESADLPAKMKARKALDKAPARTGAEATEDTIADLPSSKQTALKKAETSGEDGNT